MLRYESVAKTYRGLFGRTIALEGFSLHVRAGEIVGLVGANGAGKTTAILLALGYLDATAGRVLVLDAPAGAPAARSRIGWVPDEPIFAKDATGAAFLSDWLAGHGWEGSRRRARVEELLASFGLVSAAKRRIATYSLGMQQKIALALALSHRPELLILDEPFSALDHRAVLQVRDALDEFRKRGGGVLISSHHLSELELVSDRVVFLKRGRAEREEALGPSARSLHVHLRLDNADAARALLERDCPLYLSDWTVAGQSLSGHLDRAEQVSDLIAFLAARDVRILSVSDQRDHLEEIFLGMEARG
jgi:ABC-2 type transport system ATP-binding protein